MEQPLVSIIITNYNYGKFLREAIDSALNQTYPNVEAIVVDDGSTDNSREIIQSYGDRIVPILKENGGQASAFNAGFAASQGEIICFLDSDDLFSPEKAAEIVDIFVARPDIGWCYHIIQIMDDENRSAQSSGMWLPCGSNKFLTAGLDDWSTECDVRARVEQGKVDNLFCCPPTSGLCFRRSLLQQILPMPESEHVSISDNYIKFIALGLSKGYTSARKLAIQRIHPHNAFSFRQNRQQVLARIDILTAYWMRKNFPVIEKLAHKMFARGLNVYWQLGGVEDASKTFAHNYLSSLLVSERIKIKLMAIYYYTKTKIWKFYY